MPRFLPYLGARVLFLRTLGGLLTVAIVAAACGSSSPVANPDDSTVQSDRSSSTSPSTSSPSIVDVASSGEPSTTSSSTTSTTSTTVEVRTSSFDVVDDIDRGVAASDVVVADSAGRFLATAIDLQALGCEGSAPEYYVVVGAENEITEVQLLEGERSYAGFPTISPNRRQVLDVDLCEGFLGDVVLYDLGTDLQMGSVTPIDTGGTINGDATWTSDGFIAMFLSSESPFSDEPSVDGAASDRDDSDGSDAGEPPVPALPAVAEFLVNPRTGQRTQSGSLDQFHYGAVRLPDGRLVYTAYGTGSAAGVTVVVGDRGGTPINSYPASSFAISPDANWMLVWDWVFDSSEEITIELVNLGTAEAEVLAAGSSLQAKWAADSGRVAFSNGLETYVYDLPTGDMITVGGAEPVGCESDTFVVWGRVPMAFAPSGDLYVGDAICGESDDGFPFDQYQVRQIVLS